MLTRSRRSVEALQGLLVLGLGSRGPLGEHQGRALVGNGLQKRQ